MIYLLRKLCVAAIIPRTGSGGLELAAIVDSIDEKGVHKAHTLVLELAAIVDLIPALLAGDPLLLVSLTRGSSNHSQNSK
jgi:hypothetical protein